MRDSCWGELLIGLLYQPQSKQLLPSVPPAAPLKEQQGALAMPKVEAGRPSACWLHAASPIPPDTALTLWLKGPKTYRGVVAERDAPTVNIEARFAVRVAGEYTLLVEDVNKRPLLKDKLTVVLTGAAL